MRYAIDKNKKIQFGYRKTTDKGYKQRIIRPVMLEKVDHDRDFGATLCVRGYCELRKAERIFALKRMRGLRLI
ncbi:WYL domain-containing protein [Halomonas litopenaei]|uniref:WYL domain-containing protein n=1 Tax=Halomonas litopenaei TaxID=2109328 RepID=UPI001A906BEA|nr:WYL domain-containing protein [Halomonas litopenaei]